MKRCKFRSVRRMALLAGLGAVLQFGGCGLTTNPTGTVAGFVSDFTRQWVAAMLF
jgi:hypothetical protein